jgi:F-type H+-transporting ATPase subunit a
MQAKFFRSIIYFCSFFLFFLISFPEIGYSANEEPKNKPEKKFNAGEMIIEHVIDAHDWHIANFGQTEISIPLPIILYDNGKIVTFMSSNLRDDAQYKGYKLCLGENLSEKEKKYKGKIVKVDEKGVLIEPVSVPLDFSITKNVLSLFISVFLLTWIFLSMARKYKRRRDAAPSGFQSMVEPLILFVRDDIAKSSIGEKRYEKYMPFLLTIFFFIFFNNLLGLIPFFPGGANLTGNIAVTMVMALFTFVITTFSGNKHYWKEIYNAPGVPWWLKIPIPLMPLVEVIGVITKPFVLMVRLFANITAGHIIGLGFISLIFIFGAISHGAGYGFSIISVFFYIFMGLLELLVAFIQAYVFTLLSALYFGMASAEHHETAH